MWNALMWGAISGSATFIGSWIGLYVHLPKKWIAMIMALGTGALVGATAYELLGGAVREDGIVTSSIGFLSGALVFTLFDTWISSRGGGKRKRSKEVEEKEDQSGLAIFFGTLLDAIPESAMIGLSLISGGSISFALVTAIFISNLPEGLSSSVGLARNGYSKRKILFLWSIVLFLSAFSSLGGALLHDYASSTVKSLLSAFAGGGIIAMVSSTMLPEAHEEGGPLVGLLTAVGILISLILHELG
ncbi:membrane protein [Bacillus coahuilensis p1.1.43]|uniref:Membrane protein n=1 Tax=Bacillus coahuilensis p1.1.43 TaxID=1150625 RepID=A0A147K3Y9_9BACI|nr:ZIP family metal transporter [Bacillus coahuilensis]KUP04020.1 membrane protein [Bacillus coahuilensis p1.1.43]